MRWLKLFENFQNLESIILVGGGISSLYCAYKISKITIKNYFYVFGFCRSTEAIQEFIHQLVDINFIKVPFPDPSSLINVGTIHLTSGC